MIQRLLAASPILTLPDLGKAARHDYGGIVDDCVELVIIDRTRRPSWLATRRENGE